VKGGCEQKDRGDAYWRDMGRWAATYGRAPRQRRCEPRPKRGRAACQGFRLPVLNSRGPLPALQKSTPAWPDPESHSAAHLCPRPQSAPGRQGRLTALLPQAGRAWEAPRPPVPPRPTGVPPPAPAGPSGAAMQGPGGPGSRMPAAGGRGTRVQCQRQRQGWRRAHLERQHAGYGAVKGPAVNQLPSLSNRPRTPQRPTYLASQLLHGRGRRAGERRTLQWTRLALRLFESRSPTDPQQAANRPMQRSNEAKAPGSRYLERITIARVALCQAGEAGAQS